jgi:hypothetical protein
MANTQTDRTEDTQDQRGASAPVANSGRFKKGDPRTREAGRAGGKKSRRNS